MDLTSLGFKKPDVDPTVDAADLNIFVGDNMDLLNRKFIDIGFNVKDYGASGSSQTTTGSITTGTPTLTLNSASDFVNGNGINILGINEIASLVVTSAATSSDNVTVTLNEVAFLVTVTSGDTAIQVATKIRAATFAGWTTGGTAGTDTVTFTSISEGNKTDATYSAGTTGVTGTMTTTTQGTSSFITTILSGGGTTTLTLSSNASATFTSAIIIHDDTAAIQSAITAAASINGTVIFPPTVGIYFVTDSFIINSQISIFGYLVYNIASQIKTLVNKPIFDVRSAFSIDGISFAGTFDATYTLQDGIYVNNVSNVTIKDCFFQNLYNDIHLKDTVFYSTIENCRFYSAINALIWGEGTSAQGYQVTINHCIASVNSSKYGFYFENAGTVSIDDLQMSPTGCTDGGVVFASNATLSGIHTITHSSLEGSQTNGLQLLGTDLRPISYVFVTSTYIAGNPSVYAEYCNDIFFSNCYFTGSNFGADNSNAFSAIHQGDNICFSNCEFQVSSVVLTAGVSCTSVSFDVNNPVYSSSYPFIYLPFLDPSVIKRISVIGGKVGLHATPIDLSTYVWNKVLIEVAGINQHEAWIVPFLFNSWVNFGSNYSTVGYRRKGNKVYLKGFIKSGSANAGTAIFLFDVGYRPISEIRVINTFASNGTSIVNVGLEVNTSGQFGIGGAFAAANTWLNLDGLSFDVS